MPTSTCRTALGLNGVVLSSSSADLDALARSIANDQNAIVALVSDIARLPLDDGVRYQTATATSRIIRDQAIYSGIRIAMDSAIATAVVKFRLDVNFGDPITPLPSRVTLPALRPGMEPVRVLGYPVETVLAEKIATAIALGPADTRVRDYADIYTLTARQPLAHRTVRQALLATAAYKTRSQFSAASRALSLHHLAVRARSCAGPRPTWPLR